MRFIGKIREAFRVKMRDEFCAGLQQQLGINASLAPRWRREEQVNRANRARSLGLVDIPDGPIRWVNVQEVGGAMEDTHYCATYGVPDQKIGPTFPNVSIKSVRVRDGRVFGDVVRLDWKGNDFGLGVIDRLSEYQWEALMRSAVDMELIAHRGYGCWAMSPLGRWRPK